MSEQDSARVTIRLPEETLTRLREELDSFNTETARFQYLVQLYFDWKEVGHGIPAYEPRGRREPDRQPRYPLDRDCGGGRG